MKSKENLVYFGVVVAVDPQELAKAQETKQNKGNWSPLVEFLQQLHQLPCVYEVVEAKTLTNPEEME